MKEGIKRLVLLDEIRGLCICLMVVHHALFTAGYLFGIGFARYWFDLLAVPSPFFAAQFIFISGIACHLSHSNLRRGLCLLLIALGMTGVLLLVMPDSVIWFGVLHFLAVAILLYAALHRLIDRIPVLPGVIVCAVLFLLTWHLPVDQGGVFGLPGVCSVPVPAALQEQVFLAPVGIGRLESADYFPLLPWIFCFAAGTLIGRRAGRFPAFMTRSRVPFFAAVGRHSLWIYLAHQPVIYGIFWLITQLT